MTLDPAAVWNPHLWRPDVRQRESKTPADSVFSHSWGAHCGTRTTAGDRNKTVDAAATVVGVQMKERFRCERRKQHKWMWFGGDPDLKQQLLSRLDAGGQERLPGNSNGGLRSLVGNENKTLCKLWCCTEKMCFVSTCTKKNSSYLNLSNWLKTS